MVVNWRLVGLSGVLLAGCVLTLAVTLAWLKGQNQPDDQVTTASSTAAQVKKFADMPLERARPEVVRAVPATPEEMKERRPSLALAPIGPPIRRPAQPPTQPSTKVAEAPEPPVEIPDDNARYSYRRSTNYEWELLEQLGETVPELDIDRVKDTAKSLFTRAQQANAARSKIDHDEAMRDLLAKRVDLQGLPLLLGNACRTDKADAKQMTTYSRELRRATRIDQMRRRSAEAERASSRQMSQPEGSFYYKSPRQVPVHLVEYTLEYQLKKSTTWAKPGAVPALVQILQAEDEGRRLVLIALLAQIESKAATAGLVQRAVFDTSADMRDEAVAALKRRPADEVRPLLLQALCHPWAPAADHAADALIALRDREALPALVNLLDQPDPCRPLRNERGKWTVPELVRFNHLRNCQLCHAPSFDRDDPIRGLIPTPGQPIPEVYYDFEKGNFVRADFVYLRQEFSVSLPVKDHGVWPSMQRFDYLVRQRELSDEEAEVMLNLRRREGDRAGYPQRYAVLAALRGLTERDGGTSADEWRKRLREDELRAEPSSLVKMNRYR